MRVHRWVPQPSSCTHILGSTSHDVKKVLAANFSRVSLLPFSIRRFWLIARGSFVNRDQPRFEYLSSIDDPERFVWAILPHAARSFAPSMLMLPEQEARAAAVAYLYARMLDTYEDLSSEPADGRAAIARFSERFDGQHLIETPAPPTPSAPDSRDRAHLLLVKRCQLVDRVFRTLDSTTQTRITNLIREMASGMIQFSEIFEHQNGVLQDQQQVLDYCHRVIGLPSLFAVELLLKDVSDHHAREALEVSEFIQIANITRDVEKDLLRGVAYHPSLEPYLGTAGEGAVTEIATARRELLKLGSHRAPAFRRLVDAVDLPQLSPARAAAVLMMLFTGRHYRRYMAGPTLATSTLWGGGLILVLAALPAVFSRGWTDLMLARAERGLLAV
jgi:phytoene/squalene synthetase